MLFSLLSSATGSLRGQPYVWEAISYLIDSNLVNDMNFTPCRHLVLRFLHGYGCLASRCCLRLTWRLTCILRYLTAFDFLYLCVADWTRLSLVYILLRRQTDLRTVLTV
jgi:hypothetical protein